MDLLELFAGSRSIGRSAERLGLNVYSVDWVDYEGINLVKDIGCLQTNDIPFIPDIVWASPDCATYSIAAAGRHRRGIQPLSEYARKCDAVNEHVLDLIRTWYICYPNLVFFLENPRGMLRKMPFMQKLTRHTIWYCQYGDLRAKPTDIWTNSKTWKPRPACFNGNPDCHHERAPRGSRTGTVGLGNAHNRSRIPDLLCREILLSCITQSL